MTPATSPLDPGAHAEVPPIAERITDAFAGEMESLRRAMPIQRLIGGGMRFDDAHAIHAMSGTGIAWHVAGRWLGDRNRRTAEAAATPVGARAFYRYAAACFRVGQAALPIDTPGKRDLHAAMVDAFGEAARRDDPMTEKHEIPWRSGALCGWLIRPRGVVRPPVVLVVGGFDGWREEYWPGAEQLALRGVAAFLVDGPGQGETRLRDGLYIDGDFPQAFSAMADYLRADRRLADVIGLWGNSLGGFLAAAAAVRDPRFAAVCVNGGSVRPIELPERHPRFWNKVEAMVGTTDRAHARTVFQAFDLSERAADIRCPLLQLHGEPDQVFLLENARAIHDLASSTDKTLLLWPDGDHCIYNHSEEKNVVVADWFASRLATDSMRG